MGKPKKKPGVLPEATPSRDATLAQAGKSDTYTDVPVDAPPKPVESWLARVWNQIGGVVVAGVLVLTARGSLADHYYVPSGSMLPTVQIGDRIIVDKRAYGLRLPLFTTYLVEFDPPARGDVVVLSSPEDGRVLLKRVVGLPGDELEVKDGQIIVGGQAFAFSGSGDERDEQLGDKLHRVTLARGGGPAWGPERLPEDQFLVMGDNRGDSRDGRYFGLVERSAILGRSLGMYYHAGEFTWEKL